MRGLLRVQDQMEAEAKASGGFIRSTATDVLVASHGKGHQRQRMRVASQLWEAGVAVSHRAVMACSFRSPLLLPCPRIRLFCNVDRSSDQHGGQHAANDVMYASTAAEKQVRRACSTAPWRGS